MWNSGKQERDKSMGEVQKDRAVDSSTIPKLKIHVAVSLPDFLSSKYYPLPPFLRDRGGSEQAS
jgi:hypothetical protein